MRILLAIPCGDVLRCRWDIKVEEATMKYYPFPVRLAYATAVLKENGFDAHIIDGTAEELTREQFNERVMEIDPDLLVWETTASSFDYDVGIMTVLKKMKPKLQVAASGYHATPAWRECLDAGYDYVIVGECDYSILDLVRYLSGEMDEFPKGVAGAGHDPVPRPLIKNLDELPWPERDELPMEKYNDPKLRGFNVVLISSRGCPNKCSFCTVNVYYGRRNFRMRDPKDVVDEMEYLWNKYRPDELYFDDDNLTASNKHVTNICNEILERKLRLRWNCMSDGRVSEDLLRLMRKAGCTGVTLGAESADPEVLRHLDKRITRQDIREFVQSCRKLGLRSHVCWVLGLPHATKESDLETVRFAIDLPSDTLQFSICVPYIGTEMYDWCLENGYLESTDWSDFCANERCVVNQPGYDHKEVEEVYKLALKLWQRKMLFKRPDILLLHLHNAWKYQGLRGMLAVSLRGLREVTS